MSKYKIVQVRSARPISFTSNISPRVDFQLFWEFLPTGVAQGTRAQKKAGNRANLEPGSTTARSKGHFSASYRIQVRSRYETNY